MESKRQPHGRAGAERADYRHSLLRMRDKRPCNRAADKRDEVSFFRS